MANEIIRLQEELAYSSDDNKWVKLYFDKVRFPSGREGRYNRIVSGGGQCGVVILATIGNKIGLVGQYRYPVGQFMWELPRGFGEAATSEEDATRELREELGVTPLHFRELGIVHPDSGLMQTAAKLLYAKCKIDEDMPQSDPDEIDDVQWLTRDEVVSRIADGQITDGFTLAAVMRALALGLI